MVERQYVLKVQYAPKTTYDNIKLGDKALARYIQKILEENPEPNDKYLEILADYLILCMEKQEKKERQILTENRMMTVNKRETSFEGLVSQLENGEDGIYNLITQDKNVIFQPKVSIT